MPSGQTEEHKINIYYHGIRNLLSIKSSQKKKSIIRLSNSIYYN